MSCASGIKSARKRSQSRSPAGPLIESYRAATIASRLDTSAGRAAADAVAPGLSICADADAGAKAATATPSQTAVSPSLNFMSTPFPLLDAYKTQTFLLRSLMQKYALLEVLMRRG